ncbi:6006_t:CDS:1 [Ambispora leptoticha]|uniref:6006_t:CDS:1 n=1 Tax=Ambispora leptoticha TaxID=144679 RepID=A0A9N9HVA4_9GLOM|nr:6006_t:CDS:1 [Ambispora leptoticha]
MEFKYQQQRKQEKFKQTSNLITTRLSDSFTKQDMSKSPSNNQSSSDNSSLKCYCGQNAKLMVASNQNQENKRLFFACSKFNTSEDKNRCSFFCWENDIYDSKQLISQRKIRKYEEMTTEEKQKKKELMNENWRKSIDFDNGSILLDNYSLNTDKNKEIYTPSSNILSINPTDSSKNTNISNLRHQDNPLLIRDRKITTISHNYKRHYHHKNLVPTLKKEIALLRKDNLILKSQNEYLTRLLDDVNGILCELDDNTDSTTNDRIYETDNNNNECLEKSELY